MRKTRLFVLLCTLCCLGACAQMESYHNDVREWWSWKYSDEDISKTVDSIHYDQPDMARMMSNENVIVYPLEGEIEAKRQRFPEYAQDTIVGNGYTVFDPSVKVYGVKSKGDKPSYMPDYAVPMYSAGSYKPAEMKSPDIITAPLTPMERDYEEPLSKDPGRRSTPVLTSY